MKPLYWITAALAALAAALYMTGHLHLPGSGETSSVAASGSPQSAGSEPPPPAVTVIHPVSRTIEEQILVTGTLVARREILIAPEIEGLRIVEILAEEGDEVTRGQILARLDKEVLHAKLAENQAALARAEAAIAQASSNIAQAEARDEEARKALDRAKPLLQSRTISDSVFEQREAAARTAKAQLIAARDGLKLAHAEKKQIEALRSELDWRLSKTSVLAPFPGIISRRNAKIGSVASAAGVAQPMFHMVEDGDIELDAEVPEADLGKIAIGQPARLTLPGGSTLTGKVRLVSPEIDRTTRLGSLRVSLPRSPALRVGGFARGTIITATANALVLPLSAVLFTPEGARVKISRNARVATLPVETGIHSGGFVEIKTGLTSADAVIAKAGSFLREGDAVRPVLAEAGRYSEAR